MSRQCSRAKFSWQATPRYLRRPPEVVINATVVVVSSLVKTLGFALEGIIP
jgi:hypothetical protein